jgi:two-component system LytT family response regulator
MNAILIDDEEKSCQVLEWKLKEYCKNVTLLKVCYSGQEGIDAINQLKPDLIFLDIQMPGMSGFEMLSQFKSPDFKIVFVTAHDEYALKAFKYSATDFLLKPVESTDLIAAVEKAGREFDKNFNKNQLNLLINTFEKLKAHENIKKIALPTLNEIVILDLDEIVYCEGDSNYTNVFLTNGTKMCLSKTLKLLEQFLPEEHYFRIHNTHIINLNRIVKITRRDNGYVLMDNGKEFGIARSRKDEFYQKLNLLKGNKSILE